MQYQKSFSQLKMNLLLTLLLQVFQPILPFTLVADTEQTCVDTNLYCVSDTTFIYCSSVNDVLIISKKEFNCPEGYICDANSTTPCVPDPNASPPSCTTTIQDSETTTLVPTTTTDEETTVVSTTPESTTASPTTSETTVPSTTLSSDAPTTTTGSSTDSTTTVSTTTVGAPACYSHSYSKGPTCSQYYECVAVWWWYEPRLQTCNDGYYFSETSNTCVLAAESGCTP